MDERILVGRHEETKEQGVDRRGLPQLTRVELEDPGWQKLVADDTRALPFHHPAWARMLAECYGFSSFGLALRNADGGLLAGVPVVETGGKLRGRRWISLPFTDLCPPLVVGDAKLQARLHNELEAARAEAGVASVELRAAPSGDHAQRVPAGLRHTLRLDRDPEQTFARFKPSVRNKIRSAERNGVIVSPAEDEDELTRTFYALHAATRRRLGVPVQPRRYFTLLWRRVLEPGLGFLLVARSGGRAIAGAVFLTWRGTMIYKYSASDASASRLRPTNALLWHAIRSASENGDSTFDFGRTDFDNPGLRDFKLAWGTDEESLAYSMIGPTQVSGSRRKRAARLTEPLIRRSPMFVCRGLGWALYRYAA
jgi:CelD/BcsL family acetyltransferase involved in cellulose biosynthesis